MGTQFAWFYDIFLVVIIIGCIFCGTKRGLVKTVVLLGGYIIAIIAGFAFSAKYAEPFYDKFVSKHTEKFVAQNIGDFDVKSEIRDILKDKNINVNISDEDINNIMKSNDNISDGMVKYLSSKNVAVTDAQKKTIESSFSSDAMVKSLNGKVNPKAYNMIVKYNDKSGDAVNKILKTFADSSKAGTAREISNTVIKPVAVDCIRALLFIFVFIIVSILVKLLARCLSVVNKVPLAGEVNKFLGGVLGFLQGILYIYVAALILKVIIPITSNELMVINDSTINATHIFKLFYNFKLF